MVDTWALTPLEMSRWPKIMVENPFPYSKEIPKRIDKKPFDSFP